MSLLRKTIKDAFGNTKRPGSVVWPGTENDPEADEAERFFHGKRWEDLDVNSLIEHKNDILKFNSDAFVYYLPAYLVASLHDDDTLFELAEDIVYNLTPTYSVNQERFKQRMARFDTDKRKAVKDFLVYLRIKDDFYFTQADMAESLNKYWLMNDKK